MVLDFQQRSKNLDFDNMLEFFYEIESVNKREKQRAEIELT